MDGWRSGAAGGENDEKKVKGMEKEEEEEGEEGKGEFKKSASCIIHSRRAEQSGSVYKQQQHEGDQTHK